MSARHALYVEQVPVDGPDVSEVTFLQVSGTVDSSTCALVSDVLTPHLDAKAHLVLDVSGVVLLAAAGVRVLVEFARQLADDDRLLALVGAGRTVERSLRAARATEQLGLYGTLDEAVASLPCPTGSRWPEATRGTFGVTHEMAELRRTRRDLRAQVRTRPLIGQAMGMLMERYWLPDGDAAFALLRACSQQHNLKLRAVAAAVVAAPRPRTPAGMWFPGRARQAMPAARFLRPAEVEPTNRSSVLDAVLDEVLRCSGARRAGIQLVDPALDVLVLERQRGFTEEFTDFFAHVGNRRSACAVARRRGERVTVTDVAGDVHFDGGRSRDALLEEGVRALDCTPVMNAAGQCVGVISTHASQPGHRPTAEVERQLDSIARETADWLAWYQRTVVLEALEQLHAMAAAQSPPAARRAPAGAPPGVPTPMCRA